MAPNIGGLVVLIKGIFAGLGTSTGKRFFEFALGKDESQKNSRLSHEGKEMIKQISENSDSSYEVVDALDGFRIQEDDGEKKFHKETGPKF